MANKWMVFLAAALLTAPVFAQSEGVPVAEEGTDTTTEAAPEAGEVPIADSEATDEEEAKDEEAAADEAAPEATETAAAPAEPAPAEEASASEGEAVEVETVTASVEDSDEAAGESADEAPEAPKKPWSAAASFGTDTGMALFHPTLFVRKANASFWTSLSASASYVLNDDLTASAALVMAYEWTQTADASSRNFWLSDPSIKVSHKSLYKDEQFTGVNIAGSIGATAGLSPRSQFLSKYGSVSAGLVATRAFLQDKLSVAASLTTGPSFSRFTSPVAKDVSRDGIPMVIARPGGAEDLGGRYNALPGQNAYWGLSLGLSAGYQLNDKFGVDASLGFAHSFKYCTGIDEFSPEFADCGGSQLLTGSFGASYALADGYSLAAGFGTLQLPKGFTHTRGDPGANLVGEADRVNFPFWDPDLMATSFYLSGSKSF